MSDQFGLTAEERRELIPSGRAKLINNRVGWACTYLRKAGLIRSRARGVNQISEDGRAALEKKPSRIDIEFLSGYEAFRLFRAGTSKQELPTSTETGSTGPELTPDEIIGVQGKIINESLRRDLLDQIAEMDPSQFEQLVVDLLVDMGYGGSTEEAGRAVGQSNDGGIDGLINEDVLGLDTIYIQAKRWKNTVPIREIRDFAGALLAKRSNKGVFITTSGFPSSADEFVASIDRKVILIDGERLTNLMIKYGRGVTTKDTIEIKEIDTDYFTV